MMIVAKKYGQLGNRLLLSAHLIAAACEYEVTFANPSFAEYASYFPTTAADLWCRFPTVIPLGHPGPAALQRRLTYKAVVRAARLTGRLPLRRAASRLLEIEELEDYDLGSESFQRLLDSRWPLFVSGYLFRSEQLLAKHADTVRNHFQIMPSHRARVDELIGQLRGRAGTLIGVHIRQGDYDHWAGGKYFYQVQQYVAAMREIKHQLSDRDVVFLVCSNVQHERAEFGDLEVAFGTGHLIEDMYGLAETDFLIGPPSTFTGWASFYGRKPLHVMESAEQKIDLAPLLSGRRAA